MGFQLVVFYKGPPEVSYQTYFLQKKTYLLQKLQKTLTRSNPKHQQQLFSLSLALFTVFSMYQIFLTVLPFWLRFLSAREMTLICDFYQFIVPNVCISIKFLTIWHIVLNHGICGYTCNCIFIFIPWPCITPQGVICSQVYRQGAYVKHMSLYGPMCSTYVLWKIYDQLNPFLYTNFSSLFHVFLSLNSLYIRFTSHFILFDNFTIDIWFV